jgi:hypothetical protein
VNIQSHVGSDSLFHGLSPGLSGTTNPSGSVRVALRAQPRNPRYCREADLSPPFTHKPVRARMLLASGHDV